LDYRDEESFRLAGVQWKLDPATGTWSEVAEPLPRVRLDSNGTARLIDDLPGKLRIETNAPDRALLFVGESFHRGWRVCIDGQPAETLRVCGDFIGCQVQPGRHDVELSFQPASLYWGRRLSLLGLAAIGAGMLFLSRSTRATARVIQQVNTHQELAYR
jgi:hypothetical protein